VRALFRRLTEMHGVEWVLCAMFLAYGAVLLPTLEYNFDEGVYIQQALLILGGNLPYRDFFCHQTPLYPLTLAAFAAPLPDSLFLFRALSLLATALSGVFVYRIALRAMPRRPALIAPLLFYIAPVQYYGLLALPQAMMQLCCIAGIYFIFFCTRRTLWVLGSVLLIASLLYKPLSLSAAVALGMAVVFLREQRPKAAWVLATGIVVGALVWLSFDAMSDGRFSRLIQFQSARFAKKAGFDAAMQIKPFRDLVNAAGIKSAVDWNANEHKRAFLGMFLLNGNSWLLLLAMGGQLAVWRARATRWKDWRLLVTLWWAVPVFFSFFVWEPIWDHYFVVYLPPMAILGALCVHRLWAEPPRRRRRVLASVLLFLAVFLGGAYQSFRRSDYGEALRGPQAGETWLTFDPFLNFITRTKPACGLVDPLNVYGDNSFASTSKDDEFSSFFMRPDDLIACMQQQPHAKVVFGYWSSWFADQRVLDYVKTLPAERRATAPTFAWPLGLAPKPPEK
jgi:4-amino-4-deoxy-L-arabinose transferase-like glycosyltransferase